MKPFSIYVFLLSLLVLSSCQQKLYFPDRANTPGLTEAHEGKMTLSFKPQANEGDSLNSRGNQASFAADIAFAPVDHFGIIASYRTINHRFINEGSFWDVYGGDFSGSRWELGAGYFTPFGRVGKFELYGGYGQGHLERIGYEAPERNYRTRYHRFFFQPALGAGGDNFSVTGGIRLAFQKYYDFRSPNPDLQFTILQAGGRTNVERELVGFVEPFINGEVGYKYFKFNLQVGATGQYIGHNVSGAFPMYMSLGLVFHFKPGFLAAGAAESPRRGR